MIGAAAFDAFLLFASVVSFEDWRERKIRNPRLAQGLALCLAGLGYLVLNSALGSGRLRLLGLGELYYPWAYYGKVAVHLALSLAAAVLFWRLQIWPAGDAKFFVVAAFFLVLIEPNLPGFPWLLFLVFLINIFVPAGLAFVAGTLVRLAASIPALLDGGLTRRLKAVGDLCRVRAREAWPHRRRYLTLAANLLILFVLVQLGMQRLTRLPLGPFSQLGMFFGMMLLWPQVGAAARRWTVSLAALSGGAAALAASGLALGWDLRAAARDGARMFCNFGIFLSLGWFALNWWLERESLSEAQASSLRGGDILSEDSFRRLKQEAGLAGKLGKRYCDGLTEDEAAAVRACPATAQAMVYRAIPFAVWIFLGALITLSCKTTVMPVLLRLVHARPAHAR